MTSYNFLYEMVAYGEIGRGFVLRISEIEASSEAVETPGSIGPCGGWFRAHEVAICYQSYWLVFSMLTTIVWQHCGRTPIVPLRYKSSR